MRSYGDRVGTAVLGVAPVSLCCTERDPRPEPHGW